MNENNEGQFDVRGEKVPYQPVPAPMPTPAPIPAPAPVPVQPKAIHKPELESPPDYEWEEHYKKPTKHYHILKTLHKTMITSERMIHLLLSGPIMEHRRNQIQLLYECSDACSTTFRCISRNSPFCGKMAKMCARVCKTYCRECTTYTDMESQMASQIIMKCANECRRFSEVYRFNEDTF
jgi:hypothetical protein